VTRAGLAAWRLTSLLLATLPIHASAATPGGFRVGPGLPTTMVGLREALVLQGDAADVSQTTVSVHGVANPHWMFSVALPVVVSWDGDWRDVGTGQLELGARHWFASSRNPMAIGMEFGFPVAGGDVLAWGELPRQTVPAAYTLIVYEVSANPRAPFTLRLGVGWLSSPWYGGPYSLIPVPIGEVAAVQVVPVAGPFAVVVEGELVADLVAASGRALVRLDAGPLSIDAGVQLSANVGVSGDEPPQPLVQLRWFPGRTPRQDPAEGGSADGATTPR
jgi:hypothetical protein